MATFGAVSTEGFGWKDGAEIVVVVAAFFTAVTAGATVRLAFRALSEVSLPDQLANIPEFFRSEYTDRKLVKILKVNDVEIDTLRNVRHIVHGEIMLLEPVKLQDYLDDFAERTLNPNVWLSKFAYEVSLALQSVGAMVLAGAIPLTWVMEMNGVQFIEDWGYCQRLVREKVRSDNQLHPKNGATAAWLGYQRRHGEWLAYAAALYISRHWEGERLIRSIDYIGGLKEIRKREKQIRLREGYVISKATAKTIESLFDT